MQQRNQSLDTLRGFAILTMVLSGSIAFGDVLPAWMYHAQVPPPDHKFVPTLAGITWVDLVFPFFLFALGNAMAFVIPRLEASNTFWQKVIKRSVLIFLIGLFLNQRKLRRSK